jgi:hypothetical protein
MAPLEPEKVPWGAAFFNSSRRRDRMKPYQATRQGSIATGVYLNSGWPEIGSVAGLIKQSTLGTLENCRFQCMGTNTLPRCCASDTWARTTIPPHSLRSLTSDWSSITYRAASSGCSSA